MSVNIKGIIKCSLIAIFAAFFLIFILSLLSYFTNISEGFVNIAAYVTVIIGAFVGAFLAARGASGKKLVNALLVCAVYTAVLVCASFAMQGGVRFNGHTAAVIGGIFAAALLAAVMAARE